MKKFIIILCFMCSIVFLTSCSSKKPAIHFNEQYNQHHQKLYNEKAD